MCGTQGPYAGLRPNLIPTRCMRVVTILRGLTACCYQSGEIDTVCGLRRASSSAFLEEKPMAVLKKGARITGSDRTKLAAELRKSYDKGKSIRELADSHG